MLSRRVRGMIPAAGSLIAGAVIALVFAGCGSGGGSGTPGSAGNTTPAAATRSRVHQLLTVTERSLAQSGAQSPALASIRNGGGAGAPGGQNTTGGGTGGSSTGGSSTGGINDQSFSVPMMGGFIRNLGGSIALARSRHTRQAGGPGSPGFYYNDFLGLWVDEQDTATQFSLQLYVDQAKTQPAGSVVVTSPGSFDTFPQIFIATYNFTAGALTGSNGTYSATFNLDGSGQTSYHDTYPDHSHDTGSSAWTARGDYTWSSETVDAQGGVNILHGSFHADGSGDTHSSTSDGYTSDNFYNADGSGHGQINGPAPGLPATITWDTWGNTTIVYADGSVEHYAGWGSNIDTGTTTGAGTTGTTGVGTSVTSGVSDDNSVTGATSVGISGSTTGVSDSSVTGTTGVTGDTSVSGSFGTIGSTTGVTGSISTSGTNYPAR